MATLQATNSLPALQHQACAQSQFSSSSSFRLPEPAARPSSPFHTLSSRKSVQNPLPRTVSAASHHHHPAALNASEKDASVSVGNEATTSDLLERAIPNPSDLDLSMHRRTLLSIATATIPAVLSQIFPEFPAHALVPSLQSASSGEVSLPISSSPAASTVNLKILGDCVLGVSSYPDFVYNPRGGGGVATAVECEDGRLKVDFDLSTVYIPAVEFSTTTLLGAPLPPPLRIDIESQGLEGYIDRQTGQVELNFLAKFYFSAGSVYKAPPLLVTTVLTTESSKGVTRSGQGERMDAQGVCRLVGTARVPPVDDVFFTNFLMLPTDVLAELPARFTFSAAQSRAEVATPSDADVALRNGQYDLHHKLLM